ncbi:MAG: Gfo/Idh/MocA family oxidoreductase [Chitinophagaceae bacterium]|nr:Gfo/Idh/MocA family oxidoreductase [Chitinophagaceae bacterium]
MNNDRRAFLKNTIKGTAAISIGGMLPSFTAASYSRIIGANERLNVGMMGVNSRGFALARSFAAQKNARVISVSDVDIRAAEKCISEVEKIASNKATSIPDFRKALESKDLDILAIAAPDHWHAPAAILAAKAGKNVYLEKPASHNPNEGELLVRAALKYKTFIQMGNQRRSWPNIIQAMNELHDGVIGRPYFAKTWYTNNRESIGIGQPAAVPSWLDYNLWQGPAPRKPYQDNLIHYNWHWFWNWGTGEALNNGVHTIDLARWGLRAEFPTRVTSAGGRYRYKDDWQTPDTQVITLEFNNNTSIAWEGRSCNGRSIEGAAVGCIFYGETGSLFIGEGNGYTIYDLDNKEIKKVTGEIIDARNTTSPADQLDAIHIQNFLSAISKGTKMHSPIAEGHKSTLLCQLGNISLRSGNALKTDPGNGRIIGDKQAQQYWSRKYEPGWEPVI